MVSDSTTFALVFTAVFGTLAFYLWRLDRQARDLEARLRALQRSGETAEKLKDSEPEAGP